MLKFNTLQVSDVGSGSDLLGIWKKCRGYYKCPVGANGELLGPLVGYAGEYQDGQKKKHWVGLEYYNFASVEEHHRAVDEFAGRTYQEFYGKHYKQLLQDPTLVLAAPMGGIIFGQRLARSFDCRFGFAEKKVTKAGNPKTGEREESYLWMDRHTVKKGDIVLIAEDVVNNFSTTDQLYSLITNKGGYVLAIACALNRSPLTQWHPSMDDLPLPVVSPLHIETPQYKQHDPAVKDYIAKNQIIWKPKDHWDEIEAVMAAHA